MSTQTVYFDNPADITNLKTNVAAIQTQIGTGTNVQVQGDILVGSNISVRNLQDQVYNLQAAVNPAITTAGALNTQSYFGADSVPNQNYRQTDDQHSKHFYDKSGVTSDNIQYLQLDSASNVPSNLRNAIQPALYQNTTGTYIVSTSVTAVYYTGSSNGINLNTLRRREMWNLLQDNGQVSASTGGFSSYTGFVTAWGSGLSNITDRYTQGASTWTESSINSSQGGAGAQTWGNYGYVWVYDTSAKTVRARSVVSMTRELWGASSPNWKFATSVDGFVSAIGNDLFIVSIVNNSTYGLLVFDINLNPITIMQVTAFSDPATTNSPIVDYNDTQAGAYESFGLQTDQIKGHLIKRWTRSELGTGTYINLQSRQPVDVFGSNNQATFIYVSSASQATYNASEYISIGARYGVVSPLAATKWDYSTGKVIAWALTTGAAIGPAAATGTIASANGYQLVPVLKLQSNPDQYVAGDKLQLDSFTLNPLTSTYDNLTILYPTVDIRDTIIGATGALRSKTGAFAFDEGFKQTVFTTGGANTGATSGIQSFAISVCCLTGTDTVQGFVGDVGNTTVTFSRNKRFFQDIYGQYYYSYSDSTGTYYQQNFLADGVIQLDDIYVKFYVAGGSLTVPQYVDTKTDITYVQQADGTYLSSPGGNPDPSSKALQRKIILNNGFSVRYVFVPCNLTSTGTFGTVPLNGITTNNAIQFQQGAAALMNPTIPPFYNNNFNNCPRPVFADFNMPDGTVFDSTALYTSEAWSLKYIDWNNFINNYGSAAGSQKYNNNYSKTGTYSASLIKDYFNFIQAGLPSNVVNVYIVGDTVPAGANAGSFSGLITDANVIYFQAKGEVFNGQLMKMTYTPASVNNLTLTSFQAKQLNYYGGGIYGNSSIWQDPQGESHLFVGHGNTYYMPFSEQQLAANYATKQAIIDLAAGKTPLSASTIALLGLDNIVATPGPSLHSDFTKVNCSIWNTNGTHVLDCTQNGITVFLDYCTSAARPDYSGTGTITLLRQTDGLSLTAASDQTWGQYRQNLAINNVYGLPLKLSGAQLIECNEFVKLLRNYHQRYMSNRKRAQLSNTTTMWNAKNLTFQQNIRGAWQATPAVFSTVLRDAQGNLENWYADNTINNDDEIEGTVTAGSVFMASAGKTHIKLWKISDATAAYATNVSYNGKSRFAVSYDGSLGAQFDFTSTGTNSGLTTTRYGNISDAKDTPGLVATLGGSMMYLGKQGGKDVFAIGTTLGTFGKSGNYSFFTWLKLNQNTKLNISPNHDAGFQYIKSQDGKVILFHSFKAVAYQNFGAIYTPLYPRTMQAFTLDDNGSSIKYLWNTIITNPAHPELTQMSGTGTSTSTGLTINRNTAAFNYAAGGNGISNSTPIIINDVIVQAVGSYIYFLRADTGEIVGQMLSSDFYSNECNMSDALSTADAQTKQGERGVGAPVYNAGNLYFLDGPTQGAPLGLQPWAAAGRKIYRLNVKQQTPQALNLTSLLVTGAAGSPNNSQTVVFTPQDAIARNSNQWCLLTTFRTTDWFQRKKSQYISIDTDYDALYYAGVSAIAIYDPTNVLLSQYQASSLDISTRFINGGSWYERTGISFRTLLASGVVKFLYAGQVPYKVAAQSPFVVSDDQRAENVIARRQKLLLQQYYLAKNASAAPYQNDGFFVENNGNYLNSIQFVPYYSYVAPTDGSKAVIFNESLGYTDVGTRPLSTPL